jgi:hypothetical protein
VRRPATSSSQPCDGAGVASFDAGTGRRLGFLRSGGAFGVALDGAGNLYVGNDGSADPASFVVRVFAPGSTKPMRVIQTRQQLGRFAVSAGGELALAGFGGGDCCANELESSRPARIRRTVTSSPRGTSPDSRTSRSMQTVIAGSTDSTRRAGRSSDT